MTMARTKRNEPHWRNNPGEFRFRRDTTPGIRHAAASYRRMLNRMYRRRANRAVASGNDVPRWVRSADWDWF